MHPIKKLLQTLPWLFLWLLFSFFLWCWIFSIVTQPPAQSRFVMAVDAAVQNETTLALRWEAEAPQSIHRVQIIPFTYAMMGTSSLENADLLIIREEDMEVCLDWLAAVPEELQQSANRMWRSDNTAYGLWISDGKTGPLQDTILYGDGTDEGNAYYLCFGKKSVHDQRNTKAVDNAVITYAKELIQQNQ